MRVLLDRAKCDGAGLCELLAPEVFQVEEDGRATLFSPISGERCAEDTELAVPDKYARAVADASASCPAGCINVIE